jgi:hypothetical protein
MTEFSEQSLIYFRSFSIVSNVMNKNCKKIELSNFYVVFDKLKILHK